MSRRKWIWSVADKTGQGGAAESEGWVFGRGAGDLFEVMEDSHSGLGVVSAAGSWVGSGGNFVLEVGFGGVV